MAIGGWQKNINTAVFILS